MFERKYSGVYGKYQIIHRKGNRTRNKRSNFEFRKTQIAVSPETGTHAS